jgi:hypothetical protein
MGFASLDLIHQGHDSLLEPGRLNLGPHGVHGLDQGQGVGWVRSQDDSDVATQVHVPGHDAKGGGGVGGLRCGGRRKGSIGNGVGNGVQAVVTSSGEDQGGQGRQGQEEGLLGVVHRDSPLRRVVPSLESSRSQEPWYGSSGSREPWHGSSGSREPWSVQVDPRCRDGRGSALRRLTYWAPWEYVSAPAIRLIGMSCAGSLGAEHGRREHGRGIGRRVIGRGPCQLQASDAPASGAGRSRMTLGEPTSLSAFFSVIERKSDSDSAAPPRRRD